VELLVVIVSTHVEGLEELVTLKLVPFIIPKIGVGVKVTLINTITHAFEVFKTPYTISKDTPIVERP